MAGKFFKTLIRSQFVQVLLGATILIAIFLQIPPHQEVDLKLDQTYPWQVESDGEGSSRVFGIHLGYTPLSEVQMRLRHQPVVTLFATAEEPKAIEAYFEHMAMGGLRAKLVATLQIPDEVLLPIYLKGTRIAKLGSGNYKVTLADDDLAQVMDYPVISITYLPTHQIEHEMAERRFGPPSHRVVEQNDKLEHWLYPEKGLALTLSQNEKELLQYVPPRDFYRLARPLGLMLEMTTED
jgi:hypothetical protein